MFSELSNNKTLLVIDQGSRDAKLAQWKVEDCKKDDCRLETAKALFEADLMLIAKVDSIGNQCTLSMQIREVKTGQVKSSQFEAVACDPIAVLSALKASSAKLWPVSQ
jgi:hypothetical protein